MIDDAVEEELSTCPYTKNVNCKEVVEEELEAENRTRKVKGQRGYIDVIQSIKMCT